MHVLISFQLSTFQWALAIFCGLVIGMSKTGISGAGMIAIPVLASVFGGRPSTGLLLPMLVVADIIAVSFYSRHAEWKYVFKLLPWTITGVLIALFIGKSINDEQFRHLVAYTVIAGIILMIFRDFRRNNLLVPSVWWFSAILGLGSGFASMIGNAAGPVMAFYLLSMCLPKNNYIGTGAWFFLILNVIKVPLHIFVWKTITAQSLSFDFLMLLPVAAGAFLGYYLVRLIPERIYRIFIILTTIISAVALV